MTLDKNIVDTFSLLGLLLVFLAGYFAALLPTVEELLQRPTPSVRDDRLALARRLITYRRLFGALIVLVGCVLLLLLPLSRQVVLHWSFTGAFRTVRAGLLLTDLFLLAMGVAATAVRNRLGARSRSLVPKV